MSTWQPYLIAIVIGLLVGIEREKAHPNHKAMGVRTFLLISLLGALAGGIENAWLPLLLTAFAFALIILSYVFQPGTDRGLTTEFAAGIIFCIGYGAHQAPALSAIIGPIVALILFSKTTLHRFTSAIKPNELEAALLLLLAGVVVVNLVPNAIVDPWGVFNPRKFGFLILTLAALEFSSYLLSKMVGHRKGSMLSGFLGGLVSSTAVLLSSAKQASLFPNEWRTLFCSSLAATLSSMLELIVIVGLISPILILNLIVPVGAGILLGAIVLTYNVSKAVHTTSTIQLKSPLDWKGVLRLSFALGAILALISLAKLAVGENAAVAVSFLTGLFELHGVTLANATMFAHQQLSKETANLNILLAIIASLLAKIGICWTVGRASFAKAMTAACLAMLTVISIAAVLMN